MMKNPALTVNMGLLVNALCALSRGKGSRALEIAYSDGRMLLSRAGLPISIPAEGTWPNTAKTHLKWMPKLDHHSRPVFPNAVVTMVALEEEIDIGGLCVPCKWEKDKKATKPKEPKQLSAETVRRLEELKHITARKVFTKE